MTASEHGALWSGLMVLGMMFVAGLVMQVPSVVILSIVGTALAFMGYQLQCWAMVDADVTKASTLLKASVPFSLASWPVATFACLLLYLKG